MKNPARLVFDNGDDDDDDDDDDDSLNFKCVAGFSLLAWICLDLPRLA